MNLEYYRTLGNKILFDINKKNVSEPLYIYSTYNKIFTNNLNKLYFYIKLISI